MKIQSASPEVEKIALEASTRIKESIERSTDLNDAEKAKAKQAVDATVYTPAEIPNTGVYKIAVGALALSAGAIVVGALILTINKFDTPEFLQVTLATIIGALAGMIIPTSRAGL